jgi:outer membrane lipoprotein carrier protein
MAPKHNVGIINSSLKGLIKPALCSQIYSLIFAPLNGYVIIKIQHRMKKISTNLVVVLLSIITATAQPAGMGKSDPEAKKILDAVSAKFKSFKAVQAKFTLKIENATGKLMGNKTGTVYMKGNKYRISVTGQEIFCDGNNVSTYDKSANEITITKIDPSANTITPQKIFTNFYDKDFLYKLNGDKKIASKTIQEIELTPIDKSKPFFKVLLFVDKAASTITSTKLFEKAGNKYTYSVANMNTTGAIGDAQFIFDAKKFPGAEVVDLR